MQNKKIFPSKEFDYAHRNSLRQAIEFFGSIRELGRQICAHPSHIGNWIHRDKTMPPRFAKAIEKATNGQVKAKYLCPQIFA